MLSGGAGRDQFIFNRLSDRQDEILDFTPRKDKIMLRSLLDRTVKGGFWGGNAIAKGYVQLQQIGSSTRIDIDRNGKLPGGITPLVTVDNIAIASLKPSNFVF